MKQKDVIIGVSYLFKQTDVEHRKSMVGTVVTVVGKKAGQKKVKGINSQVGKTPTKFLLSNGNTANAGELSEIVNNAHNKEYEEQLKDTNYYDLKN